MKRAFWEIVVNESLRNAANDDTRCNWPSCACGTRRDCPVFDPKNPPIAGPQYCSWPECTCFEGIECPLPRAPIVSDPLAEALADRDAGVIGMGEYAQRLREVMT